MVPRPYTGDHYSREKSISGEGGLLAGAGLPSNLQTHSAPDAQNHLWNSIAGNSGETAREDGG